MLVLPIASLQVLRIYEGVLLRQTQGSLVAQSAFVSASYRAGLLRSLNNDVGSYGRRVDSRVVAQTVAPDLASSKVLAPLADPRRVSSSDSLAHEVGASLSAVLREASSVTGARIRVFDPEGVVVATTEADRGLSVAHNEEVRLALAGVPASRLRRVEVEPAPIAAISRNATVRVTVAEPILVAGRVAGGVLLSHSPSTILAALYGKRVLLIQAAVLVVLVVVGIALVAARTLVLPIRRLGRAAGRLARRETDTFDGGRPYRVVELAELATSVQAMADSLQQRARYVRDFARHVNHEFKTPIAAMRGAIELLREQFDQMTFAERAHFFANVDADIGRLERLTLRLLELAYADTTEPSDEATDVLEVARAFEASEVHVGHGTARACIARGSIEAVLRNLIDNALECGARRVDVDATTDGEQVVLDVADDGPGISPGNRARVFEPFFTTRRDSGGTGLGLSISRSLMRHAGGDVTLRQTGCGTVFRVTLPVDHKERLFETPSS